MGSDLNSNVSVTVREKDCRDCWHANMREQFCTHPESFNRTLFGVSLEPSRREGGHCGPSAVHFEPKG